MVMIDDTARLQDADSEVVRLADMSDAVSGGAAFLGGMGDFDQFMADAQHAAKGELGGRVGAQKKYTKTLGGGAGKKGATAGPG